MKQLFIILLAIFSKNLISAQSITKQVIGTAGKTLTNSTNKLSWTTGEPLVGIMTGGGIQLGNGYYPALNLQALSIEDTYLDLQIKIYPNPTSQFLYLSYLELNVFSVQILDLNGKQIYTGTLIKEQSIDISNFIQGIYLVIIEDKETKKKNIYKIIKK